MEKKNWKEKEIEKFEKKYKDSINDISDLTLEEDPNLLFYFLIKAFGYLLDNDPEKSVSKQGIAIRKKTKILLEKLGPKFLLNPQIFENRNDLMYPGLTEVKKDTGIVLPKEPVIWAANHAFKDDTLASVIAMYRDAYIVFGSLPQFYNTFDGITAWINGVAITNRKVKASKKASIDKCIKLANNGADLFIFPEGVWNKSPNELMLHLWPGIYRIAKETGMKVVPIAHYMRDCSDIKNINNPIHTVIDEPIKIDDLSEKAALEYIRDVICTWYYLMMEKYGQSTRDEELKGFSSSHEAWEYHLKERRSTVDYYDESIELNADYRPKEIIRPEDVWAPIAELKQHELSPVEMAKSIYINKKAFDKGYCDTEKEYAKKLIHQLKLEDYQRRF